MKSICAIPFVFLSNSFTFFAFFFKTIRVYYVLFFSTFEEVSRYLDQELSFIPLTFILGFYVSTIVQRWTIIFTNMGYIESAQETVFSEALLIGNYVQGDDEETKMQRRAMVRYMCLSQLLVYRDISVPIRRRFPTYDAIVKAGFMLEHEKEKLESIKLDYDKYWVPINWSYTHMFNARRAGKITSDVMTNKLTDVSLFMFTSSTIIWRSPSDVADILRAPVDVMYRRVFSEVS
ncbi:unnamed protein product [Toxocara canis]|uniref:Bestrophin homolog n=1 Tax=Toxocara canis TaxID=6265 RepID=A0A3P7H507_TOXCA|nr:unnamed protein product [Toxocara canis]